jgi:hypothetical protein
MNALGVIPPAARTAMFWLPIGFAPLVFGAVLWRASWLASKPVVRLLLNVVVGVAMFFLFIFFYAGWGRAAQDAGSRLHDHLGLPARR